MSQTSVAVTSMCVETTAVSVRPWCVMGSKTVPGGRRKSSAVRRICLSVYLLQ